MKFSMMIASAPDRDEVYVEISANDNLFGEIYRNEEKKLMIDIFSPNTSDFWSFEYEELIRFIEKAKNRLVDG